MSDILRHIRKVQQPHHDTLYCNPEQEQVLINSIGEMRSDKQTDTLNRVSGLDVVTHPRFVVPIACERGEVFPLAGDYD